ncbi:U32 family peptidase [Candidatus Falkowbacteria bacterium]|uniref:Peptidase U32 n=1 Tax=Candidatus Buchananbacteria bacterium CG10_big_fil_rev_8_21_14_0_10_33_19 TaxID=1974525 RepID=A0A2H0W4U7_9BACT|nr:U32 family peptidase [Candidatus Falkowbacteria bacterium]PIS06324.1 MAG: peptidase U32 [Candidatus Buchananbacteria bacterium CG10_big_fil_rev_8_21_14_0_10_33_19]
MKRIELLAPAGSLKKLKIAFAYGADAVYIGLPAYSLRAKTDFDLKDIKIGIDYAHQLGKKVYITINIFAHNRHFKLLPNYLKKIKEFKPDAIILADPGVLAVVKRIIPEIPVHLSTQMNTLNYEAVKFWQDQGVERVILGRETSLVDIVEIHKKVPKVELEIFVHGSMCMSYSGRCYLSAWFNKRSANLGMCTQSCRWNYNVYLEEPKRPGEMIPVEQDENGTYIMNSKDLNLMNHLESLSKAGIVSFKIEGRTKSIYYLATVIRAYRQAMDLLIVENSDPKNKKLKEIKSELNKIDNRGYTTGFLLGDENNSRQEFKTSKAMSDWEFVGEVVGVEKLNSSRQTITLKAHNSLDSNENIEILTPRDVYKIKFKEFFTENGKSLDKIRGGTAELYYVEVSTKYDIVNMSLIRKIKA